MVVQVRAGCVDITPETLPVEIAGNAPGILATSVADRLEASVVIVSDDSSDAALVSLDTLYIGHTFRAALLRELGVTWDSSRIFLAATHSHNAPGLDVAKPLLGGVSREYLARTVSRVADLIRRLTSRPPVMAAGRVSQFPYRFAVNRRRPRLLRITRNSMEYRKTTMGPNPRGPVDELISAVLFEVDGSPLAVIWSASCHPTSFPDEYAVTAHYPGVVRAHLRRELKQPDLPVLFFQGFSGDVRPPSPPVPLDTARAVVDRLRLGKGFGLFSPKEYSEWSKDLAGRVSAGIAAAEIMSGQDTVQAERDEFPASLMVRGAAEDAVGSVHALRVGDLTILGASAEPVTAYALALRREAPGSIVMPVGCIDDVWGYLPTAEMLGQGGYEASAFCRAFGVQGVQPECEEEFSARTRRVLGKLRRGT